MLPTTGDRLPNGAVVIAVATHRNDATTAYVLAETRHEYVTWMIDPETHQTETGRYFYPPDLQSLAAALSDLQIRTNRLTP